MNEIKIFKLINGDEIIAESVGANGPNWIIKKVRIILMHQNQSGQVGLGIMPWLASNIDGQFELYPTAMLGIPYDPEENLKKEYLQQTTGIAIPK